MIKYILALILLLGAKPLFSQDQLGVPQIVNYTDDQYMAGIQNWCVKQDKTGMLYFGNNEGLLSFNGKYWNLYKLPNSTSVRSIGIDSKNRIYVGGQDEVGFFYPDEQGKLKFNSLVNLVPKAYRKFADIWEITILNDEVFFRAVNVILHYKDGIIKTYKPNISWRYIGQVNRRVYADSEEDGLMVYDKETWKPFCQDPILKTSGITSVLPYTNDTLMVSTKKNGLFLVVNNKLIPKKTSLDPVFYNERIYVVNKINKDLYAVGTTSGGVYLMTQSGKLVQKYNYREGVQSNNVRGIWLDQHKNMWLALDDGIAFVAINSAVKNIFPDRNKQTTSYTFRKFGQQFYVGTSNGLYTTPLELGAPDLSFSSTNFTEVKDTKGQVWNLDEVNGQLMMGHEDGAFLINDGAAKPLYSSPGTWVFQPMSAVFPSKTIIVGTYFGLQRIIYANGILSNQGKLTGAVESLRFLVTDNSDNIWTSHPYHGVYRMEMTPDFAKIKNTTLFTQKDGLPSSLYNYVYRIKNRIVVATLKGVYEYDARQKKFVPFKLLNAALTGLPIQYLKEDNEGNVWFVTNKKVGVIDFNRPGNSNPFSVIYLPELDGKVVGGFESIYPLNSENVFIGANKGAYHINYDKYVENLAKPEVSIGSVKLLGKTDSTVFGGYYMKKGQLADKQDLTAPGKFDYNFNSLHFEFSSTLFEQEKNIEFSYQLVGFDKEWSPWTNRSEKDYTNLPSGSYTFNVKARTGPENQSEIRSYTFEVSPAWYNSVLAKIIYALLCLMLLRLFIRRQKNTHKREQDRLSYLHQLELDRTEKEIVRLEYEKLEADVNYKNKELSTMTMHLVQRGKVLAKIKEVISSVIKNHDVSESSPSFRHLIRLIRDVEKGDQDLDHLTMHFNNVNTDFFNRLKDRFPELSQNDLKFCAYLRMNLSSKEMAQLMNITIKAVEVGRYRLRKKLQLMPETNLYEFLIDISRGKE
ncbi:triple tyrosine motif-containing protein [Pedobacter duraquae]|uniref:YXYXY domain-containing protein n=1 Tax=Pedobacter duraquae TaxID=425511 RepID=A0A4R6IHF7_9SPHI|nr:triple tyrosine motif-containing protein [Pedobacter duraquae]TDO21358.1 YXYXY domain-containing protein [Pedobacter duraquae]